MVKINEEEQTENEDKWSWLNSLKPLIRVVIIIFLICLIKIMVGG